MKSFIVLLTALVFSNFLSAQTPVWRDGKNAWAADSLGNHRAVVQFAGSGKYAAVLLPWRRADANPANKKIIVVDAKTNRSIKNFKTRSITPMTGDIVFEPLSGKGTYYI